MDYREQGFHARGVYPTQYTSRMETARVKQEVNTRNSEEWSVGTKRKNLKQCLTSAEDVTIDISEGRESPYHRFN